ncbi:MAG: DUF4097 domain-containing protein [Defluviitaleaceae bacterium]|nr:DUF4097 domain-containing protein [Defluviitaleaceae bacterium]
MNNQNGDRKIIPQNELEIAEILENQQHTGKPYRSNKRWAALSAVLAVLLLFSVMNNFVNSRFNHRENFLAINNESNEPATSPAEPTDNIITVANTSHAQIPAAGIRVASPLTLTADVAGTRIVIETHNAQYIHITYEPPTHGDFVHPTYMLNGENLEILQSAHPNSQSNPVFNWNNVIIVNGPNHISTSGVITIFIPQNTNNVFDHLQLSNTSGGVNISGSRNFYIADNLQISIRSGGITAQDFNVANLNFSATSGGVRVNNVFADFEFVASTTSGGVTVNDIAAENINLQSTSGGVNVNQVTSPQITARSTSGGVRLDNLQTDTLVGSSTSGGVRLQNSAITGATTLTSTSGGVNISNTTAPQSLMNLSTISGRITVNGERWNR